MALTAVFDIGNTGGGACGHFPADLDFTPGPTVSERYTLTEIDEAVSTEERRIFARILLKMARQQNPTATLGQLRTAIEAKTWDFTVTVA